MSATTQHSNTIHYSKEKESLKQIFEELINDLYSAERQLLKAVKALTKAIFNEKLQNAFEDRLQQTKSPVQLLEKIMERLRIRKKNEACETIKGLIEEGQRIIRQQHKSITRDTAFILIAQKAAHYKIAAYDLLVELADVLGMDTITDQLKHRLEEEKETGKLLFDMDRI